MDDPESSYAPRSPDLSAIQSTDTQQPISAADPLAQQTQLHISMQGYQPRYTAPTQSRPRPLSYQSPPPNQSPVIQSPNQHMEGDSRIRRSRTDVDDEWTPEAPKRGRRSKKIKIEPEYGTKPAPGVEEGIVVKTKFPVARIKRIMQADEDVGKVAQVTPTAVCKFRTLRSKLQTISDVQGRNAESLDIAKALELFMISLVTKAAAQARAKSSKKVTAAHLKQVVEQDEQFDFLTEIVSKVQDAPAPKKDDDSDGVVEGKKKRASRKRVKSEDEDY